MDGLADLNPIRYRGYFYDKETQLYYLQTRYYDPATGRFISPDTVNYLDPETIHGLNLYAYGLNNPIMYVDPSGHAVISTIALICLGIVAATTISGAIFGGIAAGVNNENIWTGIGKGALNGFIIGSSIALTIGGFTIGGTTTLGSIMATYGMSVGFNMLEVAIAQGKKSYQDGDSFWAGVNDINNAMFINSGSILMGNVMFLPIPLYGVRLSTKSLTLVKVLLSYYVDNLFESTSFMTSMKTTLTGNASKFSLFVGYGMVALQFVYLMMALFGEPNSERWTLY